MLASTYERKIFSQKQQLMKNLKGVRKASGLTQWNLSMRSGVSLSRIVKSEIAGLELRPEEIAAIRKILGPELAKNITLALEFQSSN